METKKGISLIVLVITIIVMGILASVVVFISADSVNNSKIAAFSTDLTEIEDLIDEYYLNNNALPIVEGTTYTKAQVVALITNGADSLSDEITSNGDDSSSFYEVDLSKLPIDDSASGNKNDDETDVYLVSSQNFNVYYLKGKKIANVYYFSLAEKLTGKKKVNNSIVSDTSNITISSTTEGIKLTKNTSEWTNAMEIDVQTTLGTNETIEYLVADQTISTSTKGEFTINVSNILTNNAILMTTFHNSDVNKVVTVNKYDTSSGSNVLIASANINVFNLDMLSGTTNPTVTNTKYTDFILSNISGYTDLGGSGVKEARVIYTTKLDSDGNIVPYYSDLPTTITAEYVKNSGVSFNANVLKLPTDVQTFVIVFIDNAGNVSNPVTCSATE